ncbi:MAG: hypothetical protein EPGJADBJ_04277 [Saprospiraceae bacterium]|nr:hypothetical protein [Saprospiraceae bacterium]
MYCYGHRKFSPNYGYWGQSFHRHKKKRKKMRFFFFLMMLVLMAGSIIVGIFYLIAKLLGQINFNPESQAWKKTVEGLRTRLRAVAAGALVPWDKEMLALLSLNRINVKKPGFFSSTAEGVFTTIFQEPVLAYTEQKSGNTGVIVARTSDREFIFRLKGKETEIWLNGQPFGILVDGSLLAAGKTSRLLARIEKKTGEAQFPVLLGDSVVASIANPALADSPNPRALTLLREVSAEEESVLLALTVLQVIK